MPLRDPTSSLEDTGLQPCYVPIHEYFFPELEIDGDVEREKEDNDQLESINPLIYTAIPEDILSEIFIRTLPTAHNAVISPNQPPLLLTRISRGWRAVALSTPSLWASIHIPAPVLLSDPAENDDARILDVILPGLARTARAWLARSGDLPLSISLRINADDMHSVILPGTAEMLTNTFIHLSRRWRHLSVESVEDHCIQKILRVAAADAPILQSLIVDCGLSMGCTPDPDIYANAGLFQALNLRSLSVDLAGEDVADLPVNWSQLTSLSVRAAGEISLADLAHLFRSCTNAEQIVIHPLFPSEGGPSEPVTSRITCPHLQRLNIIDSDDARIELYKNLDLPNLRRLDYFHYPHMPYGLASLLPGTTGSIRHLITNPCVTPFPEFISWLEHCPRLETLSLVPGPVELFANDSIPVHDSLLDLLAKPSGGLDRRKDAHYLCPDLRHFECLVPSDFSVRQVLNFIQTKQAMADPRVAKLGDIIVLFDSIQADAAAVEAELVPLRKDGLHAQLVYRIEKEPEFAHESFVPISGLRDEYTEGFEMGVFGGTVRL